MKRRLNAVEARRRLGELLEGVYYRGDEVIIERAGKAMAAVIPMTQYDMLERSKEQLFELIEKNWDRNRQVPTEVLEAEIAETVSDIRSAGRGKTR